LPRSSRGTLPSSSLRNSSDFIKVPIQSLMRSFMSLISRRCSVRCSISALYSSREMSSVSGDESSHRRSSLSINFIAGPYLIRGKRGARFWVFCLTAVQRAPMTHIIPVQTTEIRRYGILSYWRSSLSPNPISTPIRRIRSGCCARPTTGHAAAPPSPAMNVRRRISHAPGYDLRIAYRGPGRMGTGCIWPGGQPPAIFIATRAAALGPQGR
jgi:hypothetical protein